MGDLRQVISCRLTCRAELVVTRHDDEGSSFFVGTHFLLHLVIVLRLLRRYGLHSSQNHIILEMNRIYISYSLGEYMSKDFNLLLIFDALMRERNVSRVAKALHLSQPAMSHALQRLFSHLQYLKGGG